MSGSAAIPGSRIGREQRTITRWFVLVTATRGVERRPDALGAGIVRCVKLCQSGLQEMPAIRAIVSGLPVATTLVMKARPRTFRSSRITVFAAFAAVSACDTAGPRGEDCPSISCNPPFGADGRLPMLDAGPVTVSDGSVDGSADSRVDLPDGG